MGSDLAADRSSRRRLVAGAALATSATGALIAFAPRLDPVASVAFVVAAFAGWALAVRCADHAGRCALVVVSAAAGVAVAIAVLVPPRGSGDLWGYVMYGRTIAVHHANPYVHAPAHYAGDPFLARMGRGYWHTRAPYGPGFLAYAAAGTALAGRSALLARLFFQATAAMVVAGTGALLWRRTRSAATVAWVVLNPLVIVSLVNEGHSDGLLALAVLGAVLLAANRRTTAAGGMLGIAALLKLPALLALPAVAVWVWRRHGRAAAARVAAVGAGVAALGYLPFGTTPFSALDDSARTTSRAVPWSPLRDWFVDHGHSAAVSSLPLIALVGVAVIAALLALGYGRDPDPARSAGGALAAFALAGAYVVPWYAAWALPVLALRRSTALARLVALQGAFLLVVYQLPDHADAKDNGLLVHRLFTDVAPVAIFGAAVVLAVLTFARRRPLQPRPVGSTT